MRYDVDATRDRFPALADGTAFFDGPGGTQTPDVVAEAVAATLVSGISNRGEVSAAERRAEGVVHAARDAVGDLLAVDPDGVVFGRSATALTFLVARTLARGWTVGDEVVVSRLDHDANVRPWVLAAEAVGASIRFAEFDPASGELTAADVASVVGSRTKVVAVTAASNLIGTRPDLPAIAKVAHDAGALFYVDGVHATAHVSVDVATEGADFWVCSPYKFLGPHHGVLAAAPALLESLRPDKLVPSTDVVPERFELGTLPYELLAGTTAAIDFLATLAEEAAGSTRRERLVASFAALDEHEKRLSDRLEHGLRRIDGIRRHSNAARRTPTMLMTFDGHDVQDVRRRLADRGVNAPAGHFYAWECSHHLGLGATGGLRVGLAPYTNDSDIDRLLEGLAEATRP
ncbi:MAG: cysteine desulfurase-like protein [Intrasporangium sp.]|uniref:cysteine desulfurase-like protein n=1 Tax=Intrasporangium sp. TaxID=1925024 RepID=UPI0026478084|nr:cysteine desulfurase-like protein [Intrasporangium sp.]MDN5795693.1 cysteine desulfurase-like protein [Intrasporangium sp.]